MQSSHASAVFAREQSKPLHRSTVLVVDDDDDFRTAVADVLRDAGHLVTEAPDGTQGFELLQSSNVDLVLLDLRLPGLDGWTFRAKQLAEERLRDIPVVVMTADDGPQARAIHASAVLHKPIGSSVLSGTVRRVLADRKEHSNGVTGPVSDALSLVVHAVGHELANPLMALIHGLENSSAELPGRIEADPEQLLDECWRIVRCVRGLRDLPCPAWTRDSEIDLHRVVRSAIARVSADGTCVVLEVDGPAWVRGDPLVVLYLCTALLRNASEVVPGRVGWARNEVVADADVLVRLRLDQTEVVLDVHDFGPKIPEDELRCVGRAPSTPGRGRAWGAGLRLSFIQNIVDMLGGLIEISNVPDGGVRSRVRFPASLPRASAIAPVPQRMAAE